MEKYKVSVLLTIYNVGDYLEECLDSIINQSYKNLEIVCVNNGSQDNCEEILTAYKAKDDRIKVVSLQKNVKLCSGRNASLDNATGDLVCFVDPDDVIGKNYIQFMVNEFIAANKTNSINLVINPKAMNFENKKDERFLSNKLSEYNTEYLGNYIEDSNNFISKNNLIKSTRTDCIIPMWGRLYKLDFLKQINVRFIDGFMIDNIPFTAICNEHMEKWWITNNKLIPNETYYRRVELITFKDGTDLNEDPSGLGSITSNVLFKSFEMISCLDQWVKFAPHVKNPFFDIFFATYERHIFQSELFFKYQEFFDKYKNEITNSEMYTNLEKNFVFHISKLSYPDFNLYFFRYFKDQYLKSLIKTSTDDKKAIQLPKKVIYLFKKLELIKIKYITLDNKFIRAIYIFGIHLFNFEFVGNIIKVKIGEFEIVRVRKP